MVFFVLSGFVVYWATTKPPCDNLSIYFKKRFLRVYTVWALAMLVFFVITSIETNEVARQPLWRIVGNIFMLQDFASGKPAVICDPLYGDTPLWSLHYEWWFYMLFPAVLLIHKPMSRVHTVGAIAFLSSVLYVIFPNPLCRLLAYFSIWWVGAHAAECLRSAGYIGIKHLFWPLVYVTFTAVPLIIVVLPQMQNQRTLDFGIHPVLEIRHLLGSAGLVVAAFIWRSMRWIGFKQSVEKFSIMSPISFSLYVLHYRTIVTAKYLMFVNNEAIELVLYICVTLVMSYCFEVVLFKWARGQVFSSRIVCATLGSRSD